MNRLYIVGFGAGDSDGMTIEAKNAILESNMVVGYTVYTELMKKCFPEKKFYATAMRQERERVIFALENAARGQVVSLICSGDSSVYGMAGLTLELSCDYPDVEIKIISGVTAALSGGAVLGSPLGHDFAVISLSDLLTPWELIKKRLECAAAGDFVMVLYNPASKKRSDHIAKACEIILQFKSTETVCGYVRNIGRDGQKSRILSLSELSVCDDINMFTTVFIGNSETKMINGKMVTPRGYKNV